MRNDSTSNSIPNIPLFTKADSVLNTPGQFFFQATEENEIKYGKNNTLNKKKVEEIKTNIQLIFKKIGENLKSELEKDHSYYNPIIHKLERFSNSNLKFPGLQVINLTKDHIEIFSKICDRVLMCEKSDGVRYLLIHFVNDIILFLGRNMEFYFVELNFKLPRSKYDNSQTSAQNRNRSEWDIENFLDGELVLDRVDREQEENLLRQDSNSNLVPKNLVYINDKLHEIKFLVFDGVVICGANIGHLKFRQRLRKVNEFFFLKEIERKFMNRYKDKIETSILESMHLKTSEIAGNKNINFHNSIKTHVNPNTKFKIDLFMKDYYTFDKLEFLYNKLVKSLPHDNDGVIINFDDYPYYTGQACEIYKWKPSHLNTIDFEITTVNVQSHSHPNEKKILYVLNVTESRDKLLPIACLFFPDDQEFEKFHKEFQEIALSGKGPIAECFYNFNFNNEETTNYHLLCDREIIRRSDSNYVGLQNLHSYNFKLLQQEVAAAAAVNKKFLLKKYEFGSWQFLRFRKDKLSPNSSYTYFSIMKSIMENVQMSDIMNKIEEHKAKGIKAKLIPNQSLATFMMNSLQSNHSSSGLEFDDVNIIKTVSNLKNERENVGLNLTSNNGTNVMVTSGFDEDLLKKKRGSTEKFIERIPSEKATTYSESLFKENGNSNTKSTKALIPKSQKAKKDHNEDVNQTDVIIRQYVASISNSDKSQEVVEKIPKVKINQISETNAETPTVAEQLSSITIKKPTQHSLKKEKDNEKRDRKLKQANQSLSLAFSSTIPSKLNEQKPEINSLNQSNNLIPQKEMLNLGQIEINPKSKDNKTNSNFLLNDEDESLEESSSD